MADRPLLITLGAILLFLFGLIGLLAGLVIAGVSGVLSVASFTDGSISPPGVPIELLQFIGLAGTALGVIILFFAVIVLLVARGFWNGSGWTRFLALILLGLTALGNIWTLVDAAAILVGPLVSLLVIVFFIYYLTRPHVEAFFS